MIPEIGCYVYAVNTNGNRRLIQIITEDGSKYDLQSGEVGWRSA